jgi:hypothetical protein
MLSSALKATSRPLLAASVILGLTLPVFAFGAKPLNTSPFSGASSWTINAVASAGEQHFAAGSAGDGAFSSDMGYGFAGGAGDAFFARLSSTGSVEIGGYIGGNGNDSATDIAVSATGQIVLVGRTDSEDFPVTSGAPFEGNGFVAVLGENGMVVYSARFPLSAGETPKAASDGVGGFLAAFPGQDSSILVHAFRVGQDWRATIGSSPGRVKKLGAVGNYGYALSDLEFSTRLQEYLLADFGGERVGWRDYRAATDFGVNPVRHELVVIGPAGSLVPPTTNTDRPDFGPITNGGDGEMAQENLPVGNPPSTPPAGGGKAAAGKGLVANNTVRTRFFFIPRFVTADSAGHWYLFGDGNLYDCSNLNSRFIEGPVRGITPSGTGLLVTQDTNVLFLNMNTGAYQGGTDAKAR